MSEVVAVEALIRGRVQGVYYRGWTEEQAVRRGLSGWVRNNPDGTVSALFAGRSAAVDDMIEACQDGPLDARVDGVETAPVEPPPGGRGFRIMR